MKKLRTVESGLRPEGKDEKTLPRTLVRVRDAVVGVGVCYEFGPEAKEDPKEEVDYRHLDEVEEEEGFRGDLSGFGEHFLQLFLKWR